MKLQLFSRPFGLAFACIALVAGCSKEDKGADPKAAPSAPATPSVAATTPPPVAAPAGRDACAMLKLDELKAATGLAFQDGKASKSGGADVCTWMDATAKSAILQVYPSTSSYEGSRSAFEGLYKSKAEDVSGVGDKAFVVVGKTGPIPTASLSATKGRSAVSVQILGQMDAAKLKSSTVALAKTVVAKL